MVSPAGLGALLAEFEENFRSRGELGASVSIWIDGEEVLHEAGGWCDTSRERPWTTQTMVPVYSATKAPAAATLLLALDAFGLGPETPVGEVWPRFPLPEATFAEMLSHQCGLAALDQPASLWRHDEIVAAVEAQKPAWRPGEGHGYHPRTFGALLDEPVRRLTRHPLARYWRTHIAEPLGLDFWIGLPKSQHARVATLYPGKASPADFQEGFYQAFQQQDSLTHRAFSSPRDVRSVREMNDPKAWSAGFPAMGGIGTASALARFYQVISGQIDGPFSTEVLAALATRRVDGEDLVLLKPTAFSCGCQLDPLDEIGRKCRHLYGPATRGFGHPGAGGSHAFADPESGLSFAYVMNQMELSVMPGIRATGLIEALYGA
ncbi:CubicO group peptidase (beta-lactamase class C family) [Haloferula luteola]|uniref:CubicO group peptidase (Beta-lactamase class C family) n=1 Tax=Haloferula luteola TaxID=595692 RepID=A0A840V0T9_9BACT|nr:serine hydrolase domain-containing protein [Haloferula luteola]MBB5351612.1 CubicO group peptidase (beta-lactamase class C family) [Haloferula luteola]